MFARVNVRQLTGLRGLAAISVVLAHWEVPEIFPALRALYWHNAAVDLFFCLSGFTLSMAYGVGENGTLRLRDYFAARFARIVPIYLLTLLFAAWLVLKYQIIEYPDPTRMLPDFLRQLVLVNDWPIIGDGVHWNIPAWSVSIEAFCYVAIFPLLFVAARRRVPPSWIALPVALALMVASYLFFVRYFRADIITTPGFVPPSPISYWVDIARGALGFTAGWLMYLVVLRGGPVRAWIGHIVDAVALAVIAIIILAPRGLVNVQATVILFPLIVAGIMNGRSFLARLMASRAFVFLGEISYSLYLIHVPLAYYLDVLFPRPTPAPPLPRTVIGLVALIAISAASFYLIERPARTAFRRLLGTRRLPARPIVEGGAP